MRLTEIRTTKLFGLFDHVVRLNMDERITIIHGPNGFGKTAILLLISAFFNRRFSVLLELPFSSFSLCFDDEHILTLTKSGHAPQKSTRSKGRSKLTVQYGDHEEDLTRLSPASLADLPPHAIEEYVPFLMRTGPSEWFNPHTGEHLAFDDVMLHFGEHFPHVRHPNQELPAWIKSLIDAFTVHYIQSQRLETIERPRSARRERYLNPTAAVTLYAQELAQQIQSTLGRYAELSQSLDRSFPHRLVTGTSQPQLGHDQLRARLATLEDRQNKLAEVGLLDKEGYPLSIPFIDVSKIDVLSIFVEDAAKKLDVFSELYARIRLCLRTDLS
jgi:hypothetical protein